MENLRTLIKFKQKLYPDSIDISVLIFIASSKMIDDICLQQVFLLIIEKFSLSVKLSNWI